MVLYIAELVPGMYIEPQQAVVEIADISRLRLRINIFEKDISGIRGWQTVRFRKGDELNGWYYGTVDNVGRSVDPVTRMIPVFVRLQPGAGNNFIDGMYVESEIIKDDRKAPGLPNGAVHAEEDKYFVFTKVNETADSIFFKKLYINRGQVTMK
jgi:multidrug efflux pump subunit AcrA (membrane-fusion protein)